MMKTTEQQHGVRFFFFFTVQPPCLTRAGRDKTEEGGEVEEGGG